MIPYRRLQASAWAICGLFVFPAMSEKHLGVPENFALRKACGRLKKHLLRQISIFGMIRNRFFQDFREPLIRLERKQSHASFFANIAGV